MKNIIFAFALSNDNLFTNNFFGDADKFAIYEFSCDELKFVENIPNDMKADKDGKLIHIEDKRAYIVSLLKSKNVSVMVSKKFSQYLRKVSDDFIPVIIEKEHPEEVVEILNKNMKWIKDELKNRQSDYMLFRIKTGILKSAVQ